MLENDDWGHIFEKFCISGPIIILSNQVTINLSDATIPIKTKRIPQWCPYPDLYNTSVAILADFPTQDIPPYEICGKKKTPTGTTPTYTTLTCYLPSQTSPKSDNSRLGNSDPEKSHPNNYHKENSHL